MKTVRSAGIVLYRIANGTVEYLLLLYPGGYWEFPKGKLEPGETKEIAAHRELKEETNLTAQIEPGFEDIISYTFKDRNGDTVFKEVYFFVGKAASHNVILSPEHRDYMWLPFDVAYERVIHHNAKDLLKKVDAFLAGQLHVKE